MFFRGKSVGERERRDVHKMDGSGRRWRSNALAGLRVADSANDRSALDGSNASRRHSCWEARKLTPPATDSPLRVALLDALPLNILLITGCWELEASGSLKTFRYTCKA